MKNVTAVFTVLFVSFCSIRNAVSKEVQEGLQVVGDVTYFLKMKVIKHEIASFKPQPRRLSQINRRNSFLHINIGYIVTLLRWLHC